MLTFATGWAVFVAVLGISTVEYISRTTDTMPEAMLKMAPFVVISQMCLYHIFNNGPSIMGAWLIFSLAMSAGRIINSVFVLQEGLNPFWLVAGVSCMIVAAYCMTRAHS